MPSFTSAFVTLTLALSSLSPVLATWNNGGKHGIMYGTGICGEGFTYNAWLHACVASMPSGTTCTENQWWWAGASACGSSNRCVPITTPSASVPPANKPKHCCPDGWVWRTWNGSKVCSPKTPEVPSCGGKPKCPTTHSWDRGSSCCSPNSSRRRATFDQAPIGEINDDLCPNHLTSCPISGSLSTDAYECLDIQTELESCGGCTSLDKGEDCTQIANADSVGCEAGSCIIYSCNKGFALSGNTCV